MADSTHDEFTQTRARWLAYAGIVAVAAGFFTALRAWAYLASKPLHRRAPQPDPVNTRQMLPNSTPQTTVHTDSPVEKPVSSNRLLIFLGITVVLVVALIALYNNASPLASGIFLLVVLCGGVIGLRQSSRYMLAMPRAIRWPYKAGRVVIFWPLRLLVRLVLHFRYAFAALTGLCATLLMAFSALSFELAYHNFQPKDEAVQFLLGGIAVLGSAIYLARPNVRLPALPVRKALAVPRHLNIRYTGLGAAVLLVLAEINGKALHRFHVFPASTHSQFAVLVVGITLVILGLSGWRSAYRLPSVRWRVFLGGTMLVLLSGLVKFATDPLPLIPIARTITDTLLFWTPRAGTVLMVPGLLGFRWTVPRPSFKRTTLVIGLAALVVMTSLAQPTTLIWLAENVWVWLIVAAVVGGILWAGRRWLMGRSSVLAAGLIVLVILAHLDGRILIDTAYNLSVDVRFWWILWLLIVGNIVGSRLYTWLSNPNRTIPILTPHTLLTPRGIHYGLLGLIILLGFATRFYLLGDANRFLIDEESFIGATHYLRVIPDMEILIPFSSIAAFPYVYPYWQMLTMELFGKSLFGLRATSAILGALTVPALYFLARTVFDRKVGLLAALLLASFPVHVHFSRIGISEVASPVFGTLAFAFMGRGLRGGRRVDYVLTGVMLGLTHYFHEGGRLLYTPLTFLWVGGCLILMPGLRRAIRSGGRWAIIRNLFITVSALVIIAAPIYYTLVATDRPLFARMVNNNSGLSGNYWQNVTEPEKLNEHIEWHLLPAFQVYLFQIDNTRFYRGHDGLIPPFLVPFFLLGVFYAMWRWRSPGMLLLLMWLLTTSLGNSLMVDSAGSPRFVMVFPALMLATAVGIRYTAALIVRHRKRQLVLIGVVGAVLAFSQVQYYFRDYIPLYNAQFRAASYSPDGYDAALRSMDFPAGTNIHIISENLVNQIETAGMLGLSRSDLSVDTLRPGELTPRYFDRLRCRVDHAFFIEHGDFNTLSRLRERYYLRAAQFTTNEDILPAYRLVLYYAPYIKGSEAIYGRDC